MKVISDIRLYRTSGEGRPQGFINKTVHLAIRRVVMKLRENNISLGEFDHLYLDFSTLKDVGTIELDQTVDRYHPWYRYCHIGVKQKEYDNLESEDSLEFVYQQIKAVFKKHFAQTPESEEIVNEAIRQAALGPKMLMRFKEKQASKNRAVIYLRLLDNGRYFPLLVVSDLDGNKLLCKDLPEAFDLDRLGEIQLSKNRVTVKPRKNCFAKVLELDPISFEIKEGQMIVNPIIELGCHGLLVDQAIRKIEHVMHKVWRKDLERYIKKSTVITLLQRKLCGSCGMDLD